MYKSLRWYLEFKDIVEKLQVEWRSHSDERTWQQKDDKKKGRISIMYELFDVSYKQTVILPWQMSWTVTACVTLCHPPPTQRPCGFQLTELCENLNLHTHTQKTHRPVCHCEKRPEVCNLKYIFFLVIQGKSVDYYSITTHKQIGSCISHK